MTTKGGLKDENHDYRNILGHNLVGGVDVTGKELGDSISKQINSEVNPFAGPPSSEKDYRMYRTHYEQVMAKAQQMQGLQTDEGFIKFSAGCSFRDAKGQPIRAGAKKIEEHKGCDFAMACFHVNVYDYVHPEPVYFIPFGKVDVEGYFLCKTCYNLLEKKRLNIWISVLVQCGLCIGQSLTYRIERNPELYVDLRIIK